MLSQRKMMNRTMIIAVVLVVIVSVLSVAPSFTVSAQNATQEADGRATSSNGSIEYPPGYAAAGITDPVQAASQHRSALSSSSGFTSTRNFTSVFRGKTNHENTTFRINSTARRAAASENLTNEGSAPIITETYYNSDMAYGRTNSSFISGPQYKMGTFSFETLANQSVPFAERYLKNANYGDAERIERNGEMLLRYEADEITGRTIIWYVPSDNTDNVSSFNSTILVDQNGIVRSLSFSVTLQSDEGEIVRKRFDRQITGLNATSVREPGWLDEATANTSGQSTTTTPVAPEEPPKTATEADTATSAILSTATESTADEANTDTGTPSNGTIVAGNTTNSSSSGPGFGPLVGVIALIGGTLLAHHRR
ncbi:PGF-CTERM sorting domain-containing protein [Halococcus dombrowskii]|uniref:PGF-CTERM sorting domain-containing protein n=2 Tax=Halococcus dombrowskii TaxID=179637 RepID=A0AAX3APM9_HALDO|nr:PGF-CTERM sorting domain-containing protein [Halococcus dombrowskii]UOO95740.1 PGF-CTERM sorting domain-containing protein [Halococcus dombrowskii]